MAKDSNQATLQVVRMGLAGQDIPAGPETSSAFRQYARNRQIPPVSHKQPGALREISALGPAAAGPVRGSGGTYPQHGSWEVGGEAAGCETYVLGYCGSVSSGDNLWYFIDCFGSHAVMGCVLPVAGTNRWPYVSAVWLTNLGGR